MTELEIEAFLAVVQTGNITKAAERLFISQPALSRRLKTLEEELGYPLLGRKKGTRVMEITQAGSSFLPLAEQWRELWRESRQVLDKTNRPTLRSGAVDSVSTYILLPVYLRLMDSEPELRLKVVDSGSLEAYRLMETGALDISFVAYPAYTKKVAVTPVFQEEMLLIGGEELPDGPMVHPSQLDTHQELYVDWNREFVQWHESWFGSDNRPAVFVTKMAFLEQMLVDRRSWSIVPASAAWYMERRYGLKVRRLLEAPADRVIYFLRSLDRWNNPMTERLLDHLMEYIQPLRGVTPLLRERTRL